MIGKHHAVMAAGSWATVLVVAHRFGVQYHGPDVLLSTIAATAAGLAPDIDEPGSTISRNFGVFGKCAAKLTRKAARGHRGLTHTLGAVAASGVVTGAASLNRVTFGVLLTVLVALALDVTPKVSESVEWMVALAVGYWSAVVAVNLSPWILPAAVMWGWHAHLITDMTTIQPIPYAWPLRPEDVRTSWKLFKSGSGGEEFTVWAFLFACSVLVFRLR